MKVKAIQLCPTLCELDPWTIHICMYMYILYIYVCICIYYTYTYSPWGYQGQDTGVGSLSLLQRIFPTQGSNPGLPHWWRSLYQLSYKGSPKILEWVAYPFSSGSFQPRNLTGVSCIAGRFFPY